jgi:hypothetical protein
MLIEIAPGVAVHPDDVRRVQGVTALPPELQVECQPAQHLPIVIVERHDRSEIHVPAGTATTDRPAAETLARNLAQQILALLNPA